MKSIMLFFIFYFLLFTFLHAQDTWVQIYQPFGDEVDYYVEDIRICPDDGYAVIGSVWNSEQGINKGFMMKTDSDGNFLWASIDTVSFISGPEPSGFVVLDDGSFITAGNNFWFGGHYLLKRNPNGIIEWTVELDNDYSVQAIELTNDSNMVTTGSSMDNTINLQKFDLEGNLIWRGTYLPDGFTYGGGYSVTQTVDDGYALTGVVNGPNNWDLLVLKTDENGDSLWTWTYDGYGYHDKGNCIIEDNNQNVYVSGGIFQQTRAVYTFIAKLDSFGDSLWINIIPDMADCFSILRINNENAFAGYSWGGSTSNGTRLYKFTSESEIIWNRQIQDTPGRGDRSFLQLNNNQFVCSGTEYWGGWITLSKTDSLGNVTSIDENNIISLKNDLVCYPNPFNPEITISFNISKPKDIELKIFNVRGQLIETLIDEPKDIGSHSIVWNANSYGSGVYFIQLLQNNELKIIQKVLLIK
jgi:hypothetical protein